jgi:DNA polymerase-4
MFVTGCNFDKKFVACDAAGLLLEWIARQGRYASESKMPSSYWERAIVFVDMDAFFASVEQKDNPSLRGRPVAVTNGQQGTCIITCSYEARARGIHTGMRISEARQLSPQLVQCPARPQRYAYFAGLIAETLRREISPELEIFSVDEVFIDVTRSQKMFGTPEKIAQRVQQIMDDVVQLPCTIGISGDKTTAKYAAKAHKPKGLVVVPPWQARKYLHDVPVKKLCGIAEGIGRFLAARGVYTCGDMQHLPIGVLGKRFGYPGRRIWLMCQGQDPDKIHTTVAAPKSMGHGKVMPPDTRDSKTIRMYLLHMSEKLAMRMRRHQLAANTFSIGLLTRYGWLGDTYRAPTPTHDGSAIVHMTLEMLDQYWRGEGVSQVSITALDPQPVDGQLELFDGLATEEKPARNKAMDIINNRYGELTLAPARLLNRSEMPNVISPAWKPAGHRQSV